MYLSDLVLLVVVVVYFARKIYQKHKSKALSDNKLDEKSFTALEKKVSMSVPGVGFNVELHKYYMSDNDLDDIQNDVNRIMQQLSNSGCYPTVSFQIFDNYVYAFINY